MLDRLTLRRTAMLIGVGLALLFLISTTQPALAAYEEDLFDQSPAAGSGCVVVTGGGGTDSTDSSGLTGSACIDKWVLENLLKPPPGRPAPDPALPPGVDMEVCTWLIVRSPAGGKGVDLVDSADPVVCDQAILKTSVLRVLSHRTPGGVTCEIGDGAAVAFLIHRDSLGNPALTSIVPDSGFCIDGGGAGTKFTILF